MDAEAAQATAPNAALAADRTMLAAERTLAAWWRTALAAQAAGIGLARLLGDIAPALIVRGGASFAVGLSLLVL